MKKICTILVTYNPTLNDFRNVIDSHLHSGSDHIVVVDNGSANQLDIEEIANRNQIKSILLSKNMGIGHAQNVGITNAKLCGYNYVILFDQDTIVTENYSMNILNDFQKANQISKVGTIGPNYYDEKTKNVYPQFILNGFKLNKIFPSIIDNEFTQVSFIIASGSLYDINIFDLVGMMDEKLFIDCVDIEWCFRAEEHGYKIFVSNRLLISHSIGDYRIKSLGREISIHSPLRKYYMTRNNLLLIRRKNIPIAYKLRKFFGAFLYMTVYLYDVGFSKKYVRSTFEGVIDGLTGKEGKYDR